MVNDTQLKAAVQNDNRTVDEITAELDHHRGHVYREVKDAVDRGVLIRQKNGRSWHHYTPDEDAAPDASDPGVEGIVVDVAAADDDEDAQDDAGDDGTMPVHRNYDFDAAVPEDVTYVPTNGEVEELLAMVNARQENPVRGRIGGPTGCGKTTLAEAIAGEYEIPLFTIQGKYTLRESDLLGSPVIVGDTSVWVDGVLVKALLASQHGPVVLLVDEVNRARAQSKSALFSALDHRAEVRLDGPRGGEVISGNPENLIVLATMNEGEEYAVEDMDHAEKRRFAGKWNVDYLGRNYPQREAALLTPGDPNDAGTDPFEAADVDIDDGTIDAPEMHDALANAMVDVANQIRDLADDATGTAVRNGVPTSALEQWAVTSRAFHAAGIADPIVRAAKAVIARPYYDDDARAYDEVVSTVEAALAGAPIGEAAFEAWADDLIVQCETCGFQAPKVEADERGITDDMECPECRANLATKQL